MKPNRERMSRAKDSKILLIGIGNIYRRDDAAGLVAARLLKEQVPKCCSVIDHTGEGAALMELWKDVDCTIVIDAVRSGAAPGTVVVPHRLFALPAELLVRQVQVLGHELPQILFNGFLIL